MPLPRRARTFWIEASEANAEPCCQGWCEEPAYQSVTVKGDGFRYETTACRYHLLDTLHFIASELGHKGRIA